MGGRTDITEHLNRISNTQDNNNNPASRASYQKPRTGMSLPEGQRHTEQRGPSSEELENRMETASGGVIDKNQYALVPARDDNDLLAKTYESFKLQQEGMS